MLGRLTMVMPARRWGPRCLAAISCLLFSMRVVSDVVPLKLEGGTYLVPVVINDKITLNFTVDSGASDVSIPADVFSTLVRTGTVSQSDLRDKQTYKLADGSIEESQRFRIRSLRVGSLELHDVIGSVAPSTGSLLLGQSFLSRTKSWSIDNQEHVLLLGESAIAKKSAMSVIAANGRRDQSRLKSKAQEAYPDGPKEDDAVFQRAIRFLLTGNDTGSVEVIDLKNCEFKFQEFNADFYGETLVRLNNVEETRSSIYPGGSSIYPGANVSPAVTIRGISVADFPSRKRIDMGETVYQEVPAYSVNQISWDVPTGEVDRLRRAWAYVYTHGCRFHKDIGF